METMITTETKARIYGLYIGQMIEYSNEAGAFIIPLSAGNLSVAAVEHPKLRLKPLSAITDEDASELTKITGNPYYKSGVFFDTYDVDVFSLEECARVTQYLQRKGYALPYMEHSVEDLVKAGIYKLEE